MALVHANITVGTTPTALTTIPNGVGYVAVSIQNRDTAAVYVGDSNITAASGANGGHLIAATSGTFQIWLHGNETIYAISAAGTSTGAVSVLYSA
jgi:hypothetical protein